MKLSPEGSTMSVSVSVSVCEVVLCPIVPSQRRFGVWAGDTEEGLCALPGIGSFSFWGAECAFLLPQDNLYLLPARGAGEGFQRGPLPRCLRPGDAGYEDRAAGRQDTGNGARAPPSHTLPAPGVIRCCSRKHSPHLLHAAVGTRLPETDI